MYAQNAISVNEMLGHSWDKILNSTTKETLGVKVLTSRGLFPEAKWYWIGFGAMIWFTFLFNTLFTLSLTYLMREYFLDGVALSYFEGFIMLFSSNWQSPTIDI